MVMREMDHPEPHLKSPIAEHLPAFAHQQNAIAIPNAKPVT
jgi:hypothetical protein